MRHVWSLPAEGFDPSSLQVTAEERDRIASLKQGTPEWLQARYGRLTASRFGAAAGHQPGSARSDTLRAMLWPETDELTGRAKDFAAYGSRNEAVARSIYEADRRSRGDACLSITETGLLVSLRHGWLGSSPDFIVREVTSAHERPVGIIRNAAHARAPYVIAHAGGATAFLAACAAKPARESGPVVVGCGEIKCPATMKLYSRNPKHEKYCFPEYYYDQIQGVMAINDWPWCDTVVYTPQETEVIRFHADAAYWRESLFPALREFYFHDFLPRLQLRCSGKLRVGEVDPVMVIPSAIQDLGVDLTLARRKKRKKPSNDCE